MTSSSQADLWRVRRGTEGDVPWILDAMARLLSELRNSNAVALPTGAEQVCRQWLAVGYPGDLVLVHAPGPKKDPVGFLALCYLNAIHLGGTYGLIQDLWVAPSFRNGGAGGMLVNWALDRCAGRGCVAVEVGLPGLSHLGLAGTERFYRKCGFHQIGTRMRREIF